MIMFAYLLKSYNHTVQGPDRVLCLISHTSYSRYIVHIQEWYESYGRAGLYLGPWKPTGFKAISKRCPCHVSFSCDCFFICCFGRDKDTFANSQVNQYCIWASSSLRECLPGITPPESKPEEHWSLNHQTTSQKPPKIMHLPLNLSSTISISRWFQWPQKWKLFAYLYVCDCLWLVSCLYVGFIWWWLVSHVYMFVVFVNISIWSKKQTFARWLQHLE